MKTKRKKYIFEDGTIIEAAELHSNELKAYETKHGSLYGVQIIGLGFVRAYQNEKI